MTQQAQGKRPVRGQTVRRDVGGWIRITVRPVLRRHRAHTVERNAGVPGDEDEPFSLGLGNQKAIEGILVVHRETVRLLRVVEGQRQVGESLFVNHRRQVVRRSHAPLRPLDRYLPPGDGADEDGD